MITCLNCANTSPDDATFCIECGKPLKCNAYVEGTKRLADTNIPYSGFAEYGRLNQPFAQATGAPFVNKHLKYHDNNGSPLYFIYKADLGGLLKDTDTYVLQTEQGYDIYYHGRKIVFMD